ncbi:hypothetical protein SAMN05518801_11822 [Novosphingobium sp. CF614]|uniref:hypothetical protein n=1 Tax=Novosphingobium sp. CF614 TaxID=1884364 RepID=UPI0008E23FDD|nr:hypothetical protein [Novosphingobium sp. CF614]SFG34535.1 hypothetical protein SAMN05518801_11822 [Novosphingobium sp. CF614]
MRTFIKTLVGTVAAGTMAVTAATPALADSYRHDTYRNNSHRSGGIDGGDVIAGALVIGGIAAIAAASSNNRDDDRYDVRYDRDYRGDQRGDYGRYGRARYGISPRDAVERCVAAATRTANRYSYGGSARVTDIRDVDRSAYGYRVEGRIAVNSMGRGWRHGDRDRGNGWGNDYRGWNGGLRGYDAGRFECTTDYRGRVADLDFSGIRGL